MVECDLPKVEIAGSSPVSRSMVTKGMFWKRFYFIVILLSCNCFLLCSDGFCKGLKDFFGLGRQQEEINTQYSDYGEGGNLNNNINNNNYIGDTSENENNNNIQDDKDEIDLSGYSVSGENNISDLKCVFLSATTSVGKTSILNYLLGEGFDENCSPTVGFEFLKVPYGNESDNMEKQIYLWDTSGNKLNRKIITGSFGNADAMVFVYDITNYTDSFNSLGDYITEVKKEAESNAEGCLFFLLGNKLDSVEKNEETKQVKREEAQKLAEENKIIFLGECSAKNNTYEPAKKLFYEKVVLRNGECTTGGLSDMLNDIIYYIRAKPKIKVKENM